MGERRRVWEGASGRGREEARRAPGAALDFARGGDGETGVRLRRESGAKAENPSPIYICVCSDLGLLG